MDQKLRRRSVDDIAHEITRLNGPEFESFASFAIEHLLPGSFVHRGLNLKGAPVKGTVDTVDMPARTVAEYSSEENYWTKPEGKKDVQHALQNHPAIDVIAVVNSGFCSPSESEQLPELFRQWAPGKKVDWFDGRRLAEKIVDELLPRDSILDRLKSMLVSLQHVSELYVLSNSVPHLYEGYCGREDDENAIRDLLIADKVICLQGISGIGKTDIACTLAK
jgi:hypothetical protein